MTDELKKKLLARHAEELKDHEVYYALAKEVREEGYDHASGILIDVADEEKNHAAMLKLILDKDGEL